MQFFREGQLRGRARRLTTASLCAVLLATGVSACGTSAGSAEKSPTSSSNSALSPAAKMVPDSLKNKTLNVSVLSNYPPAGYMEGSELVGIGPDLVRAIADDTGLKINIQAASFDAMIPGLQAKRWDFAAPPFSITDERRKVLDFVTVYKSDTVFLVRKGEGISVTNASDLCGHKVGVTQGSAQEVQLTQLSKECEQSGKPAIGAQTYGSNTDATLALSSSRVDILVSAGSSLGAFLKDSNGKFVSEPFTYAPVLSGIGFPKGSEMGPIVLQAIEDLFADGRYAKIFEKYNVANLVIPKPELLK